MKRSEFNSWFDSFFNKTYSSAMTYCMAKTGDFLNSEDILSEAYFAFYRKASKSKSKIEDPRNYFFAILKNKIASYWKKHRKELVLSSEALEEIPYEELLETELDLTPESAMKKMLMQDVLEYVSKMPALMRRAFTLHFYLGMTIEETAKELEVSVPAARNYIYRSLKEIRENFLDLYE